MIIAGKLTDDTFTTKYETSMESNSGIINFESDVVISSDAKDYYYTIYAHNTIVKRDRTLHDFDHQLLTADLIDLSLQGTDKYDREIFDLKFEL